MLLDTHVLLWLLADDPQLGSAARASLATAPLLRASSVSLWEVAIKSDLGKLTVPEAFPERVRASGIEWLDLTPDQVWASRQVTGLTHKDPFDKMLVAACSCLGIALMTADRLLLSSALGPAVTLIDARR